ITPAFASISWASSTALVRSPTGNCRPTVFEFRPRITSRSRSVSPMDLEGRRTRREKGVLLRGLLLLFPLDLDPPRRRQLHSAHVPLLGVGLSADFSIHASGFARHRRRGARKGGRYLILLGWAGAPGKH